MKPIIYDFPNGFKHGMKKDEFFKKIIDAWINDYSNYAEMIWDEYYNLGGYCDYDSEETFVTEYDFDLFDIAENNIIKKYTEMSTDWIEEYWEKYVLNYDYPY